MLWVFMVTQINKAVVQLPFLYEPHIFLQMMEKTVLLTTDIGLQVSAANHFLCFLVFCVIK